MNINITLLGVIVLTLFLVIHGYKKGMTREISGLAALFAGLFVLAIAIMLISSFSAGEMTNTVYSIILLVLFGAAYGIVKFLLRSAKAVSNLPILHFLDCVAGSVIGVLKSLVIIWIVFLLCEHNLLGEATEYVRGDIAENTFLKLLYEYNFFVR